MISEEEKQRISAETLIERLQLGVACWATDSRPIGRDMHMLLSDALGFVVNARLPHNGLPCPTWYDDCHCTVETLVHIIERVKTAQTLLAEAKPRHYEGECLVCQDGDPCPTLQLIARIEAWSKA